LSVLGRKLNKYNIPNSFQKKKKIKELRGKKMTNTKIC